ncbi:hypothetical protein C8J57DRAFT_1249516 [Mycena rebaudengoi]|nr:hypothetical protein C8J57DRAFT_1249516 [Mycena rebaudengoi]
MQEFPRREELAIGHGQTRSQKEARVKRKRGNETRSNPNERSSKSNTRARAREAGPRPPHGDERKRNRLINETWRSKKNPEMAEIVPGKSEKDQNQEKESIGGVGRFEEHGRVIAIFVGQREREKREKVDSASSKTREGADKEGAPTVPQAKENTKITRTEGGELSQKFKGSKHPEERSRWKRESSEHWGVQGHTNENEGGFKFSGRRSTG